MRAFISLSLLFIVCCGSHHGDVSVLHNWAGSPIRLCKPLYLNVEELPSSQMVTNLMDAVEDVNRQAGTTLFIVAGGKGIPVRVIPDEEPSPLGRAWVQSAPNGCTSQAFAKVEFRRKVLRERTVTLWHELGHLGGLDHDQDHTPMSVKGGPRPTTFTSEQLSYLTQEF